MFQEKKLALVKPAFVSTLERQDKRSGHAKRKGNEKKKCIRKRVKTFQQNKQIEIFTTYITLLK